MLKYLSYPRGADYAGLGFEAFFFGVLWIGFLEQFVYPLFLNPGWSTLNTFVMLFSVAVGGLIVIVGYSTWNLYFHLVMIPAWTAVGWGIGEMILGAGNERVMAFLFFAISVGVFIGALNAAKSAVEREEAQERRYQEFLKNYSNGDCAVAFDLHTLRHHHKFLTRIPANTPILISKEVLHGAPQYIMDALERLQTTVDHIQFVHADQSFLNDNNLDAMNDEDRIAGAYLQYQIKTGKKVIYVCEGQNTRMIARTIDIQSEPLTA